MCSKRLTNKKVKSFLQETSDDLSYSTSQKKKNKEGTYSQSYPIPKLEMGWDGR